MANAAQIENGSEITSDRIRAVCARYDNCRDALIEILHDLQHDYGFVPRNMLAEIADALNITRAEVYGVVTFYHDFRDRPAARRVIALCRAEACQAVGCRELERHLRDKYGLEYDKKSAAGEMELKAVYCLGNCALGPAALIDDKLYGRVNVERIDKIIAEISHGDAE